MGKLLTRSVSKPKQFSVWVFKKPWPLLGGAKKNSPAAQFFYTPPVAYITSNTTSKKAREITGIHQGQMLSDLSIDVINKPPSGALDPPLGARGPRKRLSTPSGGPRIPQRPSNSLWGPSDPLKNPRPPSESHRTPQKALDPLLWALDPPLGVLGPPSKGHWPPSGGPRPLGPSDLPPPHSIPSCDCYIANYNNRLYAVRTSTLNSNP